MHSLMPPSHNGGIASASSRDATRLLADPLQHVPERAHQADGTRAEKGEPICHLPREGTLTLPSKCGENSELSRMPVVHCHQQKSLESKATTHDACTGRWLRAARWKSCSPNEQSHSFAPWHQKSWHAKTGSIRATPC